MSRALVFALRARGVDVQTAAEARMLGRADEEHLMAATAAERIVFTRNLGHFFALHQSWMNFSRTHAGVIVAAQQRYNIGEELRRIMRLISRLSAEDMRNRLEFLSSWD